MSLLAKEIRLQSVILLLPILYTLVWAVVVANLGPPWLGAIFQSVTVFYPVAAATLFGAAAIPSERSLGVLAIQLLQPVPFWWQWTAKVATVFVLTAVLALALPLFLDRLSSVGEPTIFGGGPGWMFVFYAAAGSMYLSSLGLGGLSAALLTIVSLPVGAWLYLASRSYGAEWAVSARQLLSTPDSSAPPLLTAPDVALLNAAHGGLEPTFWWAVLLLTLWLAAGNHRAIEVMRERWRRQVWLPASLVLGGAAFGAMWPLLYWYLGTH